MRAAILGGCLAVVGCAGPDVAAEPLELGPLDMFADTVEPHLEERCASGGCHAREERPLRLYAPGQLRADPARTWLDEGLDGDELLANARSLAAFALDATPEDCLALRKPLSVRAGGVHHGGGDQFVDASDPAYRAIERWLLRRGSP